MARTKRVKKDKLVDARDRLIEMMAEYQAFTGWRVIVVFDAHLVPGIEKKKKQHEVEVIFTRENETADERIEKLTSMLSDSPRPNSCSDFRFYGTMGHFWSRCSSEIC